MKSVIRAAACRTAVSLAPARLPYEYNLTIIYRTTIVGFLYVFFFSSIRFRALSIRSIGTDVSIQLYCFYRHHRWQTLRGRAAAIGNGASSPSGRIIRRVPTPPRDGAVLTNIELNWNAIIASETSPRGVVNACLNRTETERLWYFSWTVPLLITQCVP